jgi:hypothetical protein
VVDHIGNRYHFPFAFSPSLDAPALPRGPGGGSSQSREIIIAQMITPTTISAMPALSHITLFAHAASLGFHLQPDLDRMVWDFKTP